MLETPPSTARHDRIRRLSFVPQPITWRTSRIRRSNCKKKKLKIKKQWTRLTLEHTEKKTLIAVLTRKQGPSTSVIHLVSAVRPELQEPRCSIRGQRRLLPSISKLRPSVGRENKRNQKSAECDAEVVIIVESKVAAGRRASRAPASPQPLDTLCRVRHPSSGAPRRGRAASSPAESPPEVHRFALQNKTG